MHVGIIHCAGTRAFKILDMRILCADAKRLPQERKPRFFCRRFADKLRRAGALGRKRKHVHHSYYRADGCAPGTLSLCLAVCLNDGLFRMFVYASGRYRETELFA